MRINWHRQSEKPRCKLHVGVKEGSSAGQRPEHCGRKTDLGLSCFGTMKHNTVGIPLAWRHRKTTERRRGRSYFSTRRLLTTEKTPDTPLARMFAKSLSPWVDTTPSRVTLPFSTMM